MSDSAATARLIEARAKLYHCESTAAATLENLRAQGEKLQKTNANIHATQAELNIAQRILHKLRNLFH